MGLKPMRPTSLQTLADYTFLPLPTPSRHPSLVRPHPSLSWRRPSSLGAVPAIGAFPPRPRSFPLPANARKGRGQQRCRSKKGRKREEKKGLLRGGSFSVSLRFYKGNDGFPSLFKLL